MQVGTLFWMRKAIPEPKSKLMLSSFSSKTVENLLIFTQSLISSFWSIILSAIICKFFGPLILWFTKIILYPIPLSGSFKIFKTLSSIFIFNLIKSFLGTNNIKPEVGFGVVGKNTFTDSILPFQIDDNNLRGRFARVEKSATDTLKNHHFPHEVCTLLIEALLLTVLIGEMIKIRWRLSLQVRGNESIKLLATDYYAPKDQGKPANIRAYADYDKEATHLNLDTGLFAITIDQGKNMEPYQGITPIIEGSLGKSAENYFFQSEQIKTFFDLNITKKHGEKNGKNWSASGFMLQALPGDNDNALVDDKSWNRLKNKIIEQTKEYLMSPSFNQYRFLDNIFQTSTLTVFKETKLKFGCSCKRKTLLYTLAKYPKEQLEEMCDKKKNISANCQFCGRKFQFSLKQILDCHEV